MATITSTGLERCRCCGEFNVEYRVKGLGSVCEDCVEHFHHGDCPLRPAQGPARE